MNVAEIHSHLIQSHSQLKLESDPLNPESLIIPQNSLIDILTTCKVNPKLRFEFLEFITAVDRPPETIALVYYLYSYTHSHRLALKVHLDRDNPEIESSTGLWQNADWNEREVYDLYGVIFHSHPDLRRILMPDDWQGYPLRKDFSHPNVVVRPD